MNESVEQYFIPKLRPRTCFLESIKDFLHIYLTLFSFNVGILFLICSFLALREVEFSKILYFPVFGTVYTLLNRRPSISFIS